MEESELRDIIDKAGYIITHSPRDVTHAICTMHGKIVPVNANDHNCCWIKSLATGGKERKGGDALCLTT